MPRLRPLPVPDDLDPFDVASLGLAERLHPMSMAVPAPRAAKTNEGDKANWITSNREGMPIALRREPKKCSLTSEIRGMSA